ncbi:MAG: DUF1707 domain-containing protein [Gemmatimonadota bacterium]
MLGQNNPALVALRSRREAVVEALSTHFAHDVLDMDEFEQRVDLAHRATSLAELDGLLADLGPVAVDDQKASLVRQDDTIPTGLATRGGPAKRVRSILSSVQRKGAWRVPEELRVVTVMGAVELDFREAEFGPGVTEVTLTSVMGAISIVVPSDLRVECDGASILGHFEGMDLDAGERDSHAPMLRITGRAIMGSVEIST